MTTDIHIPRKIVQNILHHAQQTPTQEVCGLISAQKERPYRSYPIKNSAEQPARFFNLDSQAHINALKSMRKNNEQLFAIYHSHPTAPAIPSKLDLEYATEPNALYLIISLNIKGVLEVRGYQLHNAQFIETHLHLI